MRWQGERDAVDHDGDARAARGSARLGQYRDTLLHVRDVAQAATRRRRPRRCPLFHAALSLACALACGLLPLAPGRAEDRVLSPEAQSAAAQAAGGATTDTFDAENLLYFVLYAGATLPAAGQVIQHTSDDASLSDEDVGGAMGWVGGFGLALIPPRFDWFAFEWHVEIGDAALDAGLWEGCASCSASDGTEPSLLHSQMGLTFRAAVPVRYFSLQFGAGPAATTFAQTYSDPRHAPDDPEAFVQWDIAFGLRLLAGIHFLVSPDVRLFLDYRTDLYMDMIGQPPKNLDPGEPPYRSIEVDGLRIHSVVAGIDFNTPGFQRQRSVDKLIFNFAIPGCIAALWGVTAVLAVTAE